MKHFKKSCCDPLNVRKCTKQLLPIRPSVRTKLVTLKIEGDSICSSCNIKISTLKISEQTVGNTFPSVDVDDVDISECDVNDFSSTDTSDNESVRKSDSESEYEKTELVNSLNSNILPALELSPIAIQKMSSEKYASQKLLELTSGLSKIFGSRDLPTPSELQQQQSKAKQFDEFISKLKVKFQDATEKNEKYQILTLLPTEWSARKIEAEFGCSYHTARTCKKLQEGKGALSIPNAKRPSNVLASGTKEVVQNFYLEDDISRMMPGKNDCVSMVVAGKISNC